MNIQAVVESALQVTTRLITRPLVQGLNRKIFFNQLHNMDIIEIQGNVNCKIHELLCQFIVNSILPVSCKGLDIDILFINTDNHFILSHLIKILSDKICVEYGSNMVSNLLKKLLNNFKIIQCYSYYQFLLTLNSLNNILLKNKRIGFLLIDNVSTFYWETKLDLSYNLYLLRLLNLINKVRFNFKILTVYTKQLNFESKKQTLEWKLEKKNLHYEINLVMYNELKKLVCEVKSGKNKKLISFNINEAGIDW